MNSCIYYLLAVNARLLLKKLKYETKKARFLFTPSFSVFCIVVQRSENVANASNYILYDYYGCIVVFFIIYLYISFLFLLFYCIDVA